MANISEKGYINSKKERLSLCCAKTFLKVNYVLAELVNAVSVERSSPPKCQRNIVVVCVSNYDAFPDPHPNEERCSQTAK